jgi:hypothetical protein
MKIYDVPKHDLETIARTVGVELSGDDVSNSRGDRWQGRLIPDNSETHGTSELAKYQRTSASQFGYSDRLGRGRKVHAVCWHGYRDFMQAVFDRFPAARIQTSFADYRGAEDFADKYPATAYKNIGSLMYPVYVSDACECES